MHMYHIIYYVCVTWMSYVCVSYNMCVYDMDVCVSYNIFCVYVTWMSNVWVSYNI